MPAARLIGPPSQQSTGLDSALSHVKGASRSSASIVQATLIAEYSRRTRNVDVRNMGSAALPMPMAAAVSDGRRSLRDAVAAALPGVLYQVCQFHYLREAARPQWEADRHAKKELRKRVRNVHGVERSAERQTDEASHVVLGYCRAVRNALTDDARPPLASAGLRLAGRLEQIHGSLDRRRKKGGRRRR